MHRLFLDCLDKIQEINDSLYFGIGKVSAGRAINIVPDEAKLEGSVRSVSSKLI